MSEEKEDKKKIEKKFITLKNVRLAFPNIFAARAFEGGDSDSEKFSASLLINPKTPEGKETLAIVEKEIDRVAKEKWGVKAEAILKSIRSKDALCLHDGDVKSDYDGFEGMMYVSAKSDKKPTIVDRNPKVHLTQQDGRPYGGCYVNALIELYAQDNKWGKRINASLGGVQFFADGEAFAGGAPASEEEFETYEDDIGSDLA
jgi:hypothetical protein